MRKTSFTAIFVLLAAAGCADFAEDGKPLPPMLEIQSGPARYSISTDRIDSIKPREETLQGVFFEGEREWPIAYFFDGCGSTSNITSNGAPYLVRFDNLTGPGGEMQRIALGADGFRDDHGSQWQPTFTPPDKENAEQVLCDWYKGPKNTVVPWSGGDMICDEEITRPPKTKRECYIEIDIHGTIWMTEFYLEYGKDPAPEVETARAFIKSIHVKS